MGTGSQSSDSETTRPRFGREHDLSEKTLSRTNLGLTRLCIVLSDDLIRVWVEDTRLRSRCPERRRQIILAHRALEGEILITRSGTIGRIALVGSSTAGVGPGGMSTEQYGNISNRLKERAFHWRVLGARR